MIDRYTWRGGSEAMLRFGPDAGPVVIAVAPLFEEANRTRAFLVALLRRLGQHGIGALLPDLPGTAESLVPTEAALLADMREALASLAEQCRDQGRPVFSIAIRSGAMLDGAARLSARWRLAPQQPRDLLRELERIAQAAAREAGNASPELDGAAAIEIAGNRLSPSLLDEMRAPDIAPAGPTRTVRLASDPGPADHKVDGAPLWRRAEPDNDLALAETLAADIAAWVRTCAG